MRRSIVTAILAAACAAPLAGAQDAPRPTARDGGSAANAGALSRPIAAWSRTKAGVEDSGTPVERGAAVFNNWCSACHSRGPQNAPGTTSLQFKYQGKVPAALEDRTDLTVDLVKLFVRNGVATMPQFRKTEVGAADLDALAAYLTRKR